MHNLNKIIIENIIMAGLVIPGHAVSDVIITS